jgi:chitinase
MENEIVTKSKYKNIGYFYCSGKDITEVDMSKITHLNISFGLIYHNEESNGQNIPNWPASGEKLDTLYIGPEVETALNKIPQIRSQHPNLKILLSIGGWGGRGFSHAAFTEYSRKKFAASCKEVADKYSLDGIDIDWEYPFNGGGGIIASAPEDKDNFTLLLSELRNTLGAVKLLTTAGPASFAFLNEWTNPAEYIDLLDFMNIMTYDYAYGENLHNANLYPSDISGGSNRSGFCGDAAVNAYMEAGFPAEKLNLGMPFYGRVPGNRIDAYRRLVSDERFQYGRIQFSYENIVNLFLPSGYFTDHWDESAKAPYLTVKDPESGEEVFVLSYDNPKAIEAKTDYIKAIGLGGAMFWQFAEDRDNELASVIARGLNI